MKILIGAASVCNNKAFYNKRSAITTATCCTDSLMQICVRLCLLVLKPLTSAAIMKPLFITKFKSFEVLGCFLKG